MSHLSASGAIGNYLVGNFHPLHAYDLETETLTPIKNNPENWLFHAICVWYGACYNFSSNLHLDSFLDLRLVCRIAGCKKMRSSFENARAKPQKLYQTHYDLNTRNYASQCLGGRSQLTGDQSIHPGCGLDCFLGACYEALLATNRSLRKSTRQIFAVRTAACVHVTRTSFLRHVTELTTRSLFFAHEKNI